MRCTLIALLAAGCAWPQANPWNYVPLDATSVVAFEWKRVLDSPQRELVRREIPAAAAQLMSGINFIEGIERVIVAQTANSTLLILNGKFEPGRLRDMAISDSGSVKAYKNAELLVASSSTEGGTQIALVGDEIVLLGDRDALMTSLDRPGATKHAANAGQYDLWLEEKLANASISSIEFALLLKDGVQLTATVHTASPAAAHAVAGNASSLGLNISELGNDVHLGALFPAAQFEQRAGRWRTSIEQLASVKMERLDPAPSAERRPPAHDRPRKVKILGLEEGEKEIDLDAPPLPEDFELTKEELEGEAAWLTSLGVKGNPLLQRPFATPLTNRSFIVPRAWYRHPPEKVSADSLRKDLPVLHTIMEKAYGGWASAEKRGWNWAQWFADWDKLLAASTGRTLSWEDALAPFAQLEDFQLDNQTAPLLPSIEWASGSRTSMLQQLAGGNCSQMKFAGGRVLPINPEDPAQQPQRALLDDLETLVSYISYPSRLGEMNAVACGGKWIDVKAVWRPADANKTESTAGYRMVSKDIAYLRPGIQVLPEIAGKEKLLIVDLRRNSGLYNPKEAFAPWADLLNLNIATAFTARVRQSCISPALHWGLTQQTTPTLPVSDNVRGWTQSQVDHLMQGSTSDGCRVKDDERKADWDFRTHEFTGKARLLVIVDDTCGSYCEFIAYVLAHSRTTVIAGTNTFGGSQFVQPGYFVLPHSRLPFRMALQQSDFYGDQRSFDGHGFNVDVLLLSQQSQSQEAILTLAERLLR